MNDIRALEKQLLTAVGNLLKGRGFDSKPVGQSFRLAKPFGWASIHLAFVRHPPDDFDVVLNVAVRVDAVQDVIQDKNDRLIKESDRKHSATVGRELGNIKGIGQQRWTVASENDIRPVSEAIFAECESVMFPFIDKFSDLCVLLEVLKSGSDEARLISPLPEKRAKTLVALSQLIE
jgi:hypothetical protein